MSTASDCTHTPLRLPAALKPQSGDRVKPGAVSDPGNIRKQMHQAPSGRPIQFCNETCYVEMVVFISTALSLGRPAGAFRQFWGNVTRDGNRPWLYSAAALRLRSKSTAFPKTGKPWHKMHNPVARHTHANPPGTGSISRRIPQDAFHRQIMIEFNCREFVPVPLLFPNNCQVGIHQATTKDTKSTKESKNEMLDVNFGSCLFKVDKSSELHSRQFYICQQLGFVNPFDRFDPHEFEYQLVRIYLRALRVLRGDSPPIPVAEHLFCKMHKPVVRHTGTDQAKEECV